MLINNRNLNIIKCGGIEIIGSQFTLAPKRQQVHADPVLEKHVFVNYMNNLTNVYDFKTSLSIASQIIIQNLPGFIKRLTICEVISKLDQKLISEVKEILTKESMLEVEYFSLTPEKLQNTFDVLLITEAVVQEFNGKSFLSYLSPEGFVIYVGDFEYIKKYNPEVIFKSRCDNDNIWVLRTKQDVLSNPYAVVNVSNYEYGWLEKIKALAENGEAKGVFLMSQDEETTGLFGLTKCLLTEPSNLSFRCIILDQATDFSINNNLYTDQLNKNLMFNVLRNNAWGTFVHLPLEVIEKKEVLNASATLPTIGDLSTITWIEKSPWPFK